MARGCEIEYDVVVNHRIDVCVDADLFQIKQKICHKKQLEMHTNGKILTVYPFCEKIPIFFFVEKFQNLKCTVETFGTKFNLHLNLKRVRHTIKSILPKKQKKVDHWNLETHFVI